MDKARGSEPGPAVPFKTAPNEVSKKLIFDRPGPADGACSRDVPSPETNGPYSIYPRTGMKTEESKGNH